MNGSHRRVAVVTGGTRGLGAAISARLARDGVLVVAAYRSDDQAARRLLENVDAPQGLDIERLDVSDADDCRRLVGQVIERHGRLDYLVNNAGVLAEHRLADLTVDTWDETLRVNLSGAFYLSKAAIEPMREARFGRIVNIGSVTAAMGSAFQIDYAAAKAGLGGLTRSLARSVARRGITVNCIVPGGFATDLLDQLTITDGAAIEQNVPVGRYGRPEELAHIVASLLHDDAGYVTGSVIVVDGGLSMGE
jgi:NAD(P)-dependent dehydrogenase (short-subunit alcohol dehydrogenase family)